MHVLIEKDFKMARKLINRGADINYINKNGYTPLQFCVQTKNEEAVRFLLEKKALQHKCNANDG